MYAICHFAPYNPVCLMYEKEQLAFINQKCTLSGVPYDL